MFVALFMALDPMVTRPFLEFDNYVSMETKHSFLILDLIPYIIYSEGNAARIISDKAKKQYVFISICKGYRSERKLATGKMSIFS